MLLCEFITVTDKTIAFASNGVLSIKQKDFETCFSKISSEQANILALALVQWASEQPEPSQLQSKPYYSDTQIAFSETKKETP